MRRIDVIEIIENCWWDTQDFVAEFGWAVRGIPSEVARGWHDSHRWDRPKGEYQIVPDGNHQSLIFVPDPEYKLWRVLGIASDVVLAVIALLILAVILNAVV